MRAGGYDDGITKFASGGKRSKGLSAILIENLIEKVNRRLRWRWNSWSGSKDMMIKYVRL